VERGGERSRIFRDGGASVLERSQLPLISAENAASSQLLPVDMGEDDKAKGFCISSALQVHTATSS
jgi:hypothetical protein